MWVKAQREPRKFPKFLCLCVLGEEPLGVCVGREDPREELWKWDVKGADLALPSL